MGKLYRCQIQLGDDTTPRESCPGIAAMTAFYAGQRLHVCQFHGKFLKTAEAKRIEDERARETVQS